MTDPQKHPFLFTPSSLTLKFPRKSNPKPLLHVFHHDLHRDRQIDASRYRTVLPFQISLGANAIHRIFPIRSTSTKDSHEDGRNEGSRCLNQEEFDASRIECSNDLGKGKEGASVIGTRLEVVAVLPMFRPGRCVNNDA